MKTKIKKIDKIINPNRRLNTVKTYQIKGYLMHV